MIDPTKNQTDANVVNAAEMRHKDAVIMFVLFIIFMLFGLIVVALAALATTKCLELLLSKNIVDKYDNAKNGILLLLDVYFSYYYSLKVASCSLPQPLEIGIYGQSRFNILGLRFGRYGEAYASSKKNDKFPGAKR